MIDSISPMQNPLSGQPESANKAAQRVKQPPPVKQVTAVELHPGQLNEPVNANEETRFDNHDQQRDLHALTEQVNAQMKRHEKGIEFRLDKDSDDVVYTVIDRQTREVIRQIPAEELMNLKNKMEDIHGILFNDEV